MKYCKKCGCALIIDGNCRKSKFKNSDYICNDCEKIRKKIWYAENREHAKEYKTDYYLKHKEHINKRERTRRKRVAHTLLSRLKTNGCAICGYNKCEGCLDFHHVNPNDKMISISVAANCHSNKILSEELTKCILLCKNCHYEIHHKEYRRNEE